MSYPIVNVLTDLAACLQTELEHPDRATPPFCFIGVVHGAQAAWAYIGDCDTDRNGMAWVRLASAYPAVTTGEIYEQPDNCGHSLGFDIEVGVARAVHWGDESGEPPTVQQWADDTEMLTGDMLRMKKAVKCCAALKDLSVLLGPFTPVGPSGGVSGGIWVMSVMF